MEKNMSDQDGGNADRPAAASPPPPLPHPLPHPVVERPSRWLPSLVWLIPLLAALIGGALVARSMLDKGPTVVISFLGGEGLEAGKTKVKYKEVDIGVVTAVKLGEDISKVLVTVELNREAKRFAGKDTRFWVVRPHIGASGVSGLGTLLSGAYIGADVGSSDATASSFTGLEKQPVHTSGQKGREYLLHAASLGSIDAGSPVYYRRIRVGQVASFELDKAGEGIDLVVFVEEPYVQFVGVNTRWWHASGIDVRLDSSGFKLNTQSLAALATGGIAFETEGGRRPGAPAAAGSTFLLAEDRAAAMRDPDGPAMAAVLYFDQSLRGLAPGAPVDFRGIVLGEVRSVGVEFDRAKKNFRMPVTVELYPDRLGKSFVNSLSNGSVGHETLMRMVARGLRGQLRTGNLLTGQLYVALDFFPNAPKAALSILSDTPVLPTVPNTLNELQSQLSSIARKLDKVPFDDIAHNLNTTLKQANALLGQLDGQVVPELKDTLTAAKKTFASAELVLQQDSPLQSDLRQTLAQVQRTMESLTALADYLERHPESLIRGKAKEKK
jgi:paraquat-inducible protein B